MIGFLLSTTSYKFDEIVELMWHKPMQYIFVVEAVLNTQKVMYESMFEKKK